MADKFHPTLPLDTKYYQESYKTFSRFMGVDAPYEMWFHHVLGKALWCKLRELGVRRPGTDRPCGGAAVTEGPLRHLGVGSGSGELELHIIRALLEHFNCIYNVVIEPSTHQIDLYKKLVGLRSDQGLTARVEFDWRQLTLEDYMLSDDGRGRGRFDVITSVHSIYYGGRMEENVPYLFDLLAEGGVMAIVLLSDTDGLSRIQRHFLSPDIAGYRFYTKQRLQSFLATSNVPYDAIDVPRFNIDVTPCFDDTSREGSLLVDFLSHMKHFRTAVPADLRERFLRLLRQNAHAVGDKLLVTHDTSAVILQQTNNLKFKEHATCK